MSKAHLKKISILFLFSMAMGFMESAIVVYLRKIYYPDGFCFPLAPIEPDIGTIEILREAATIIMLLTIGIIAGKTKLQRFSFFIFAFAVWDIFYYVFLKLLIGWPASLLDWDILFLIPVPWIGPVLAPVILSATMILLAITLCIAENKNPLFKIEKNIWLLLLTGSLIVILSLTIDYFIQINQIRNSNPEIENTLLLGELQKFVPVKFAWWIFFVGEACFIASLIMIWKNGTLIRRIMTDENR